MVFPSGTRQARRLPRTAAVGLLALVAVLLVLPASTWGHGVPSAGAPSSVAVSRSVAGVDRAPLALPTPHVTLAAAAASLALGEGPAFGHPVACSTESASQARCHPGSMPPARSHPALTNPEGWQNATYGSTFFGSLGIADDAAMAYDEADGYIVYYGGCDFHACPDNQTWIFANFFGSMVWINDTVYGNTPPAVELPSMDYDYAAHAVLLFGGLGANGPLNETWTFSAGTWTNRSAPFCFIVCYWAPTPRWGASMAFANDSLDNASILFGGCLDSGCTAWTNETYKWVGAAYAWVNLALTVAPSPRDFTPMAYATNWGSILLFGGCAGDYCWGQDTWEFYNGSWTNLTFYNSVFALTPQGRGAGEMTYDAATQQTLLVGGFNSSYGDLNDLWAWTCFFTGCGWSDVTPAADTSTALFGALASESSTYAPVLYGGVNVTGYFSGDVWVYEPGLTIAPTVTPSTGPARANLTFATNSVGGTAPVYSDWSLGNGAYMYGDGTNAYATPGTYQANVTVFDFYGVEQYGSVTVVATGTQATATVLPGTADVGYDVNFATAAATGGSAPYTYNWSFGDGAFGSGASVTHTFASAGTYTANLTVWDTHGLYNNSSVAVTIVADPAVTAHASTTSTDAGVGISFTPTETGGTGAITYAWSFGDGGSATTSSASHVYSTAGTYTVTLTVTDALGLHAGSAVTVTIHPALTGTAVATPTAINAGGSVTFTATAAGGTPGYTYFWSFGDGGTSTLANPSHQYTTAGSYTAKVWINDTVGGSLLKTVAVTVQSASGNGGNGGNGGGSTSSTSSSLPSWTLWVVLALVILVVAIVAAVLMMRRRRPPAPAPVAPTGVMGSPAPAAPPVWQESPPPAK